MDEGAKVLTESRRKGAILLPPSDIHAVAPLLVVGGIVLAIAGWVDVGLFWIQPHLGSANWEVGTISQTIDSLPLGTMALLILAMGIRAKGGPRMWPRGLAIVFFALSLFLAACMVIFLLDFPQLLHIAGAPGGSDVKLGAFKVVLLGCTYLAGYFLGGVFLWKGAHRRAA